MNKALEEKIFFPNSKGVKLCGLLSNPSADKTRPIVIFAHGFSSSKNTTNFVKLAERLNQNNISSFRFDFYGHGESKGDFEKITISEAVDDILQAIKFLQSKGYSQIGLVGSSFGGISSIIAASQSNDLFLLALKSPVSDYWEIEKSRYSNKELEEWKEKGYRDYEDEGKKMKLNYSFVEDFDNNNGYEAAPKIKVPTLIVHGDSDNVVPVSQSIKTSKLIPNCKLVTIKDANHRYTEGDHAEQMLKAISEFIITEAN